MEILDDMSHAYFELLLTAGNAVIDRDEGRIREERIEKINSDISFFNQAIPKLREVADTDLESYNFV